MQRWLWGGKENEVPDDDDSSQSSRAGKDGGSPTWARAASPAGGSSAANRRRSGPMGGTAEELALFEATSRNDFEAVQDLLESFSGDLDWQNVADKGRTVLHKAAEVGSVTIVAMLLRQEAEVGLKDNEGKTPLHLAIENGNVEGERNTTALLVEAVSDQLRKRTHARFTLEDEMAVLVQDYDAVSEELIASKKEASKYKADLQEAAMLSKRFADELKLPSAERAPLAHMTRDVAELQRQNAALKQREKELEETLAIQHKELARLWDEVGRRTRPTTPAAAGAKEKAREATTPPKGKRPAPEDAIVHKAYPSSAGAPGPAPASPAAPAAAPAAAAVPAIAARRILNPHLLRLMHALMPTPRTRFLQTMPPLAKWPENGPIQPLLCQGKYQLIKMEGKGGMASVFQAVNRSTGEVVAIKIFQFDKFGEGTQLTRDKYVEYACRECAIHQDMNHPNIVRLIETFSIEKKTGTFGVVMEHCDGDLQSVLDNKAKAGMPEEAARHIIVDIFHALLYIYEAHNVIHGDLKPSNILVRDGMAKLADFGVSREIPQGSNEVVLTTRFATAGYAAPEYYDPANKAITSKVDVYAAGKLFFRMIYGKLPPEHQGRVALPIQFPPHPPVSREAKMLIMYCVGQERPDVAQVVREFPYLHPFR